MKKGLFRGKRCAAVTVYFFTALLVMSAVHADVYAQTSAGETDTAGGMASEGGESSSETPGFVTLDFKDADILLVLRLLSLKSGVNIVAGPEVEGTVTIRLHDVHWEKALDVVLKTYGYVYERDGNIVRVTTRDNLAAEELTTEAFVLNYSTAKEIEDAVKEIVTERGRIKSVERTNTVIITDVATNVYKIGEIIKRLDKRTPQVFIDSTIVETSQNLSSKIGIDWTNGLKVSLNASGAKSTTFPWKMSIDDILEPTNLLNLGAMPAATGTLDPSATDAVLNFLKSFETTRVISNPRILTLSNKTASVQVGTEFPIPTYERSSETGSIEITGFQMKDLGVVLNVTPHVNDAREILVELKPQVIGDAVSQSYQDDFTAFSFPTTEAETQVLIRDGHTIAIGGLLSSSDGDEQSSIPYLSSIPLIGKLFHYSSKNETATGSKETIFFITCTIVDTEAQPEYLDA